MDGKDKIIAQLRSDNAILVELVKQLEARIAVLENEVAAAKKNSSNSSKPPSSDIAKPPKM